METINFKDATLQDMYDRGFPKLVYICNNCKRFTHKNDKCDYCKSTTLTVTHPSNGQYVETKDAWNFYIGSMKVEISDINEAKELVHELSENLKTGNEYSKHISDFIYAVESTYQTYHNLDSDNWDIVH